MSVTRSHTFNDLGRQSGHHLRMGECLFTACPAKKKIILTKC